MYKIIDGLSFKSKNVYNLGNYFIRQKFFETSKNETQLSYWIRFNELDKIMQHQECYSELGSQCSQETLKILDRDWMSFFISIKDWSKNKEKYLGIPKLPNYADKENGRKPIVLKNIQFKIIDNKLKISWKPLKDFSVNTKIQDKPMQLRFIPKGNNYVCEIVYEIEIEETKEDNKSYIGIDLGIDNFATVVNNIGLQPFVINGKILKSMNQYYNKERANIQNELIIKNKKHWSNKLEQLTQKRNNKIKDYLHKSSKYIAEYCVSNKINTIVIGLNKGWKQESNMGKIANQNFVSLPYDLFIKQIQYKAENFGINVILTEESYTSGTSFLDCEFPCKENYDRTRRFERGLFMSNEGVVINSDVNGAYQILKNVFPDAFANGIEGVGLHPVRINF